MLDLTANNQDLVFLDLENTAKFSALVFGVIAKSVAKIGFRGYIEHQVIYRGSEHFSSETENRFNYLCIDTWAATETPIYTPFDRIVHSFQNIDNFGEYGPMIIL